MKFRLQKMQIYMLESVYITKISRTCPLKSKRMGSNSSSETYCLSKFKFANPQISYLENAKNNGTYFKKVVEIETMFDIKQ